LNVWQKTQWPASENLTPAPSHIWNKSGSQPLELTGIYSGETNRGITHNLAGDPVISELDARNFNLEGNQLVAFGSIFLDVDPLFHNDTSLTGRSEANAHLGAEVTVFGGAIQRADGTAGADGAYSLAIPDRPLAVDSVASVQARHKGLTMRQTAPVKDGSGTLAFESVPDAVTFGSVPIPDHPVTIMRNEGPFTIAVKDDRARPRAWRLDAALAHPLIAVVNGKASAMPNAIVFTGPDGASSALTDEPLTVYQSGETAGGTVSIQWEADQGIQIRLNPGAIYSDTSYKTAVAWTLVDAP
jgi:hypothetical protein